MKHSINLHHITRATVERKRFSKDKFDILRFTFTSDDGSQVEVDVFDHRQTLELELLASVPLDSEVVS